MPTKIDDKEIARVIREKIDDLNEWIESAHDANINIHFEEDHSTCGHGECRVKIRVRIYKVTDLTDGPHKED